MALVQINKKADSTLNEAESKQFCRLQADYIWILTHKEQLRKDHSDKYIAVENQVVCFVGKDINDLISKIAKNKKQVDNFAIDFIGKYPVNLLL
jgi:hypothetical protein